MDNIASHKTHLENPHFVDARECQGRRVKESYVGIIIVREP